MEAQKRLETPLVLKKNRGELGKRLANPWKRIRVKKKVHAGRGHELKWEMPGEVSIAAAGKTPCSIHSLVVRISHRESFRFERPMKFVLARTVSTLVTVFLGAAASQAQVYGVLHQFPYGENSTGPGTAGLVLSGVTLYGTVPGTTPVEPGLGPDTNSGFVFRVNTDGSAFSNIYTFTLLSSNSSGIGTNSDGANPRAGLILAGDVLFGTASEGGTGGSGAIFRLNTDGSDFTNLYSFSAQAYDVSGGENTNGDGATPVAPLAICGNTLYGVTTRGGVDGQGTVFRVNTDGTCFTNLAASHSGLTFSPVINSGNMLYWMASAGCFTVETDGTSFTNLHIFASTNPSQGFGPQAGLVLSGNLLYGTTSQGGSSGNGTIFRLNTDGTDYTNLYQFMGTSDGGSPSTGLLLCGDKLYGGTSMGGSAGKGCVFRMNTNGDSFTNLYSDPAPDSFSTLVISDNTLYGATSGYSGLVFALSLGPIPLQAHMDGGVLEMTWGNPAFSLQTSTNPAGTYTNVSGAISPYTNTLPGSPLFFRLQSGE